MNILFYGEPGTGKTQLAKVLAAETGCELFEVASEDEGGDPRVGSQRLRAFQAAQNILSNRNMMILFDEIEDVFNSCGPRDDYGGHWKLDEMFSPVSARRSPKAWINRRLEENPAPTLWLGNSIFALDPALSGASI